MLGPGLTEKGTDNLWNIEYLQAKERLKSYIVKLS